MRALLSVIKASQNFAEFAKTQQCQGAVLVLLLCCEKSMTTAKVFFQFSIRERRIKWWGVLRHGRGRKWRNCRRVVASPTVRGGVGCANSGPEGRHISWHSGGLTLKVVPSLPLSEATLLTFRRFVVTCKPRACLSADMPRMFGRSRGRRFQG